MFSWAHLLEKQPTTEITVESHITVNHNATKLVYMCIQSDDAFITFPHYCSCFSLHATLLQRYFGPNKGL